MDSSIDQGSNEASPDAWQDDDVTPSIETVIASLPLRSDEERDALLRALLHGHDVMPLPGLEPRSTVKAEENTTIEHALRSQTGLAPLPGTTQPQVGCQR